MAEEQKTPGGAQKIVALLEGITIAVGSGDDTLILHVKERLKETIELLNSEKSINETYLNTLRGIGKRLTSLDANIIKTEDYINERFEEIQKLQAEASEVQKQQTGLLKKVSEVYGETPNKVIDNIAEITKNLGAVGDSIKGLSDLVKAEIIDGAHKREDVLLESLKTERDTNERFVANVGKLTENFKVYDETLNNFLKGYNSLLEEYKAKLDDAVSKVGEGTDKAYTTLNNCVELVGTLNENFGFVKSSNAEALGRIEELLKGYADEQTKWLEIQGQQTGLLKKVSDTHDELLTKSSLINGSLDRRMAEAERVVGRIAETAANIEAFNGDLPGRFDNIINYLQQTLFEAQKNSLEPLEKKIGIIADEQAGLQFSQKGQHDEFERVTNEYKALISQRKRFNIGVGLTVAALFIGALGYYYLNAKKPVYSNVNLQDIKCEQPIYVENAKDTTYCDYDDREGIVFIRDSDSNGKADYIVVKKRRDDAIVYYGMHLNSTDAQKNPNQFIKANNILAEQKGSFNRRLRQDESYSAKLKRFLDGQIKRFR